MDEDEDGDDADSGVSALRRRHSNNAAQLTDAELESLEVLEWPAVSKQASESIWDEACTSSSAVLGLHCEIAQPHVSTDCLFVDHAW